MRTPRLLVFLAAVALVSTARGYETDLPTLDLLRIPGLGPPAAPSMGVLISSVDGHGTHLDACDILSADCGACASGTAGTAADDFDLTWIAADTEPVVFDMATPAAFVLAADAADGLPLPQAALEYTIWGRDTASTAGFPSGWTPARLVAFWSEGFQNTCATVEPDDDAFAAWAFPGTSYRYVAAWSARSMVIYDDASRTTSTSSPDMQLDGVARPACAVSGLSASIGGPQGGVSGDTVTLTADVSPVVGVVSTVWEIGRSGTIDEVGDTVDIPLGSPGFTFVRLYAVGVDGCVATVEVQVSSCDPADLNNDGDPGTDLICGGTDCDDDDPAIGTHVSDIPGNAIDEDCDGTFTCYLDGDGDGDGTPTLVTGDDPTCSDPGLSSRSDDCDDDNSLVGPSSPEVPGNQTDDNCDGLFACFRDGDGDGHAAPGAAAVSSVDGICDGATEAPVDDDCNDLQADISPSADELPGNNIDEDCDGTWGCYLDGDGDGAGGSAASVVSSPDDTCTGPGEAGVIGDCDDSTAAIGPLGVDVVGEGIDRDCDGQYTCYVDGDGDGYAADGAATTTSTDPQCGTSGAARVTGDCDDASSTTNPGVAEVVGNEIDDDCDGSWACFVDADGDSWGVTGSSLATSDPFCIDPGEATAGGDCRDDDVTIFPGATDVPGDGIDQNCDLQYACFIDNDLDGYGDRFAAPRLSPSAACSRLGESARGDDCDDALSGVNPGRTELPGNHLDEDCSGDWLCWVDGDGDGVGAAGTATVVSSDADCTGPGEARSRGDCNDADATVAPGFDEVPGNASDENCDGLYACWVDDDGDGFGDPAREVLDVVPGCNVSGVADNDDDCDDDETSASPLGIEVPGNDIDENCDGRWACWTDGDLDGVGGTGAVDGTDPTCTSAGVSPTTGDCDDTRIDVLPGGAEVVGNNLDEDCDGSWACYVDRDGDGAGTQAGTVVASPDASCTDAGESEVATDCDDTRASVGPAQVEVVGNSLDEDCDGTWDCYADLDDDGYGSGVVASLDPSCLGTGEATVGGDCDDAVAAANPGNTVDVPGDAVDDDCDGLWACFVDSDGDGFGDGVAETSPDASCTDAAEAAVGGDCDDTVAAVNPGAAEVPADGIDQDCDGRFLCFRDGDGDGFGSDQGTTVVSADPSCTAAGESNTADDCNDALASVFPGAPDPAGDGVDQDCDGADTPGPDDTDDTDVDTDAPVDTDNPADTDIDVDTDAGDPPLVYLTGGCGCDSGSRASWAWLGLLGLVGLRRRR